MRLEKTQVVVSFVAVVVSFLLYVSPLPPFLLTLEQAHEVLLAVFGAGVSIMFAELINYRHHLRELERDLLEAAEPLISSLAEIDGHPIETFGKGEDTHALLAEFLEEEEANAFKLRSSSPLAASHKARNRLIREIERCEEVDCAEFADNPDSSFSRFVLRTKGGLGDWAKKCSSCDKAFHGAGRAIDDTISKMSYIGERFSGVPLLRFLPGAKKTRCLDVIKARKTELESCLEPVFRCARLFYSGEEGHARLLYCHMDLQREIRESVGERYEGKDGLPMALFDPLSKFAETTKSETAEHYKKPWWDIV